VLVEKPPTRGGGQPGRTPSWTATGPASDWSTSTSRRSSGRL